MPVYRQCFGRLSGVSWRLQICYKEIDLNVTWFNVLLTLASDHFLDPLSQYPPWYCVAIPSLLEPRLCDNPTVS